MTLSAADLAEVSGTAMPEMKMKPAAGGSMTLSAADLAAVSGTAIPEMKMKPTTVKTAAHKASTQSKTMPKISMTKTPAASTMTGGSMTLSAADLAAISGTAMPDMKKKTMATPSLTTITNGIAKASEKAGDKDTSKLPVPKAAVPVTKEVINGEEHHCAVVPAAKAAPASTAKTIATKVKTLLNLAAAPAPAAADTKVCSKDLNKVVAHVKATHPAATKTTDKSNKSGATYLATGAAIAATIFSMA